MSRPIRVLQVLGGLGVGGAETWLLALLRHWAQNSAVQMDFLLTGGEREVFDAEAAEIGARLHYQRYGRVHLPSFVRGYRRILAQGRYDAIHDHADYASGWRFALAAGLLPTVRVAHVHNPWLHIRSNYAISPARRLAAAGGKALVRSLASHVAGTSAEILRKYGFEAGRTHYPKVEVIHCGFDVGRFSAPREADRDRVLAEFNWPRHTKLVLFAGRLDRALQFNHPQNHKNSWLALNIVREAAERDPSVRLVMAGEGPSRTALTEAVRGWGMGERLRLPGIRNDVPALMRAADALIFPSAQEGLGMVAVEAQAAGLPVLASEAVPREAVVIPDLFESLPFNAPVQAWANRLNTMMERTRLDITACRAIFEDSDFAIANSARKLEAIYRSEHD